MAQKKEMERVSLVLFGYCFCQVMCLVNVEKESERWRMHGWLNNSKVLILLRKYKGKEERVDALDGQRADSVR